VTAEEADETADARLSCSDETMLFISIINAITEAGS
jgi:hypothetical protein